MASKNILIGSLVMLFLIFNPAGFRLSSGDLDEAPSIKYLKENEKKFNFFEKNSIIFPNGGEILLIGKVYKIIWRFDLAIKMVSISYSTDGGLHWETIVDRAPNNGAYFWMTPPTPSPNCVLRVEDAEDGEPWDVSDGVFTISPAVQPIREF